MESHKEAFSVFRRDRLFWPLVVIVFLCLSIFVLQAIAEAADVKPLVSGTVGPKEVQSADTLVDGGSNKIWTAGNDGAGSTLDADLLDGSSSSAFGDATAANQTTIINDTKYIYTNAIGGAPAADSIAARIDATVSSRSTVNAAAYTDARGEKLDNLDATISSRMGSTAINNIQRGVTSLTDAVATIDVTITAVVLAKSFIAMSQTTAYDDLRNFAYGTLTSTTNLRFWRNSPPQSAVVAWEVIEFK